METTEKCALDRIEAGIAVMVKDSDASVFDIEASLLDEVIEGKKYTVFFSNSIPIKAVLSKEVGSNAERLRKMFGNGDR